MKIYLACVDHDMTMRSLPQPEKAFLTKEAAEKYLEPYKRKTAEYPSWNCDTCIKEIEYVEE